MNRSNTSTPSRFEPLALFGHCSRHVPHWGGNSDGQHFSGNQPCFHACQVRLSFLVDDVHQRMESLVMEHDPGDPACAQEDIDYIISELEGIQETLRAELDFINNYTPVETGGFATR